MGIVVFIGCYISLGGNGKVVGKLRSKNGINIVVVPVAGNYDDLIDAVLLKKVDRIANTYENTAVLFRFIDRISKEVVFPQIACNAALGEYQIIPAAKCCLQLILKREIIEIGILMVNFFSPRMSGNKRFSLGVSSLRQGRPLVV